MGAIASPALTIALFSLVILYFRRDWHTFVSGAGLIFLVTAPLYLGSCIWTWVYMEKRYAATLGVHCPCCGYEIHGAESAACPECGRPLATR